jgi:hypothetical protein
LPAPLLPKVNGRPIFIGDGIKLAQTGQKMPAVKKLHQESTNNTKPEFIYGHSCQAIALLVGCAQSFLALPITCRIHEGVVFSNRQTKSLLDKMDFLQKRQKGIRRKDLRILGYQSSIFCTNRPEHRYTLSGWSVEEHRITIFEKRE